MFLASLGIDEFALETAKLIVSSGFDTLEKVQAATAEDLAKLKGMGPTRAQSVANGLAARREEIKRLLAVGVVPVAPSAGGGLAGKTFCFTGALPLPRKEYEDMVEKHGGSVLSGVTKEPNYSGVMSDPNSGSSKAEKARKYGTKCIDADEFSKLIASAETTEAAQPKAVDGAKPIKALSQALKDKSVCFTGAQPRKRSELEVMVTANGGTVLDHVTKGLTYLVLADPESGSSKAKKAREYGTSCIDLAALEKIIRDGGGHVDAQEGEQTRSR